MYADIEEIAWPSKDEVRVEVLPCGSLKLLSKDQYASMTLSPHKLDFSVTFLAKVSHHSSVSATRPNLSANDEDLSTTAISSITATSSQKCHLVNSQMSSFNRELKKEPAKDESNNSSYNERNSENDSSRGTSSKRWEYMWITQHHSIKCCPIHWNYPLNLLLSYSHSSANDGDVGEGNDENKDIVNTDPKKQERNLRRVLKRDMSKSEFSSVPKSLPLNCRNQHKHKWTLGKPEDTVVEVKGRIKVICLNGTVYRLHWEHPRSISIYLGDGSIIESRGSLAQYYAHFISSGNKIEERMYCLQSLPPDKPDHSYNIASILKTAARFMKILMDENLHSTSTNIHCCWKDNENQLKRIQQPAASAAVLLEENTVEALGRFTVYSSGQVRVVFKDRVSLEMIVDLSTRLGKDWKSINGQLLGLSEDTCRVMLRTGHYQTVFLDDPGQFEKYVRPALEWAKWVNTVPSERYRFYKDTIYDPEKQGSIETELKKIKCFNYILENTCLSGESKFEGSNECATEQCLSS